MRLPKLFAALVVTAMAFALCGANARAATLNAGGKINYTATLQPGQTTPTELAGIFCPNPMVDPGPVQMCGHVTFTTSTAGTVTATATFPNDAQIDLVLCSADASQGVFSFACRADQLEVQCARTQVIGPTTTTVTIICPTQPGDFELVIVPNITPCNIVLGCSNTVVTGTVSLSGTGGSGGSTGGTPPGATAGKVTGGGKVDTGTSTFSVMAIADINRYDQAHVKYQQKNGCRFRAVRVTRVVVVSNPANQDPTLPPPDGSADIDGTGYTNNSTTEEFFTVHVEDGGEGKDARPDAFGLTSEHCFTTSTTLTSGNTQIHPTH